MLEVPVNRIACVFAIFLALAGCGTTNNTGQMDDADARAGAIFAGCDAQLRSGALRSYRQVVACARQPVTLAYSTAGYPFMDLVLFDLQERDIVADRIDHGEVQPADAQRDIAVLEQRLKDERNRRISARTGIGGAAQSARPEQLLAGLPTLQAQMAVPNTDCFSVGNFTHCNK